MTRKRWLLNLTLTWLVLVLIPLPLILLLNQGLIDTPDHLMAYDFGVFAYVWWLTIVLLATRPHWLEQKIGMKSMYGIHGGLGVMALLAATIHRFTSFSMFPLIKQTGDIAWYLEIFLLIYAVLFLSGWLTDRVRSIDGFKRLMEKTFLSHQATMWIHRLNFVVIFLIWLHVQLIPRLGTIPYFRQVFDLYTVVALLIYIFWELRLHFGRTRTGTVKENQSLDSGMQAVTLSLPRHSYSFHAGDFYFLSFKGIKGVSVEPHPFSVASAPVDSTDEVTFLIHKLGDFTNSLVQVPTGSQVHFEGPFGLFNDLSIKQRGPFILYGLGSGIAPLLSLAKQYGPQKKIHIIWSGKQVQDPYFQAALQSLNNSVTVDAQEHRFAVADLKNKLTADEIRDGQVIIVGSANKVLQVRKIFKQLGFSRSQLHDERMTL